jgi:hypothetical protein
MQTLLLDVEGWDLTLDSARNIAIASDPYSQAQDAASEIKTFQGECYYDTTRGIPYWISILGKRPPLSLIRSHLVAAALTVPGVTAARVFISSFADRTVSGQVQITNAAGQAQGVSF